MSFWTARESLQCPQTLSSRRPQACLSSSALVELDQDAIGVKEKHGSDEALRQWVRRIHGVEVKYKTLYTLVRTRFRAKLKVPCPSHTKKA